MNPSTKLVWRRSDAFVLQHSVTVECSYNSFWSPWSAPTIPSGGRTSAPAGLGLLERECV
eukprot:14800220-Alexandrium_andersonii.AAC.1